MPVWCLIPALLAGFLAGWLVPHKPRPQAPPPMTEEEKRALRDFQKFLRYDGFN